VKIHGQPETDALSELRLILLVEAPDGDAVAFFDSSEKRSNHQETEDFVE
jgi:hypothetical protein